MKKLGLLGWMLMGSMAVNAADQSVGKEKLARLSEIKKEVLKGQLNEERKVELRNEVKEIRKELKKEPIIVISLTAALAIALILVLLAD